MKKAIFTICAENFLTSAVLLGHSIKENSSESIDYYVIVADRLSSDNKPNVEFNVIEFDGFLGVDFFHQKMRYNITEYCTFLKPYVFSKLFEQYSEVLYIDPDIIFYDDPKNIFTNFNEGKSEVLITPHFLNCTIQDKSYGEINHLFEGVYNFGFVGLMRSERVLLLLSWWQSRLSLYCYGDRPTSLHTDQKWGDYFPALFPEITKVLTHPGFNVAHWNLHERKLDAIGNKIVVNDQYPLVFFHFSGFDYYGHALVSRGGVEAEIKGKVVAELADKYREALFASGFTDQIKSGYDWNYDGDGNLISHFQRRILRNIDFESFTSLRDYFEFWKRNNLIDKEVQSYLGYSKNTEKNLRKKLKLIFLMLRLLRKLVGVSRYSRLVKLFEFLSRIENHAGILK